VSYSKLAQKLIRIEKWRKNRTIYVQSRDHFDNLSFFSCKTKRYCTTVGNFPESIKLVFIVQVF